MVQMFMITLKHQESTGGRWLATLTQLRINRQRRECSVSQVHMLSKRCSRSPTPIKCIYTSGTSQLLRLTRFQSSVISLPCIQGVLERFTKGDHCKMP